MEASLAQEAAAARKASSWGDCKQGRPPVQGKKRRGRSAAEERSRPAPSAVRTHTPRGRESNKEPNTHKGKALKPYDCTEQCHSAPAYAAGAFPFIAHHMRGWLCLDCTRWAPPSAA